MTLTAQLTEHALAPTPPALRDHLRALTLTNVAAGAGVLGRAGTLIDRLDVTGRPDEARVAAMRLHARTQDDFFPFGRIHVGAVTLATALALADDAGDRLLECLAAGYDVMCRVAAAYSELAQERGMRPTGVFGPLGAAATAAAALDLGPEGTANAIGLAATTSAGTNQAWVSGTDEWLLEVGAAARSGVEAAQLTLAGFVAAPEALEGAAGWARAHFSDDGAERLRAVAAADRSGAADVAAKPYPVSGIANVPAWLACRAHAELDGAEPEAIELGLSAPEAAYPGSANRGPFPSRSAALMSLAFCVACGARDGLVSLRALEDPDDPALETLIDRFTLTVRDDVGESEATLTVTAGGRRFELRGTGAEILFPHWDGIDADAVATRSEADPGIVGRAREELMRDAPDVNALKALLEEAQCPAGFNPSNAASTS